MKTLSSLVIASVLSLAAFGCASSSGGTDAASGTADLHVSAAKEVRATTDAQHERLGGVWNVTGIDNDQNLELAIIELGGGDPALNGNQLFLSAYNADHGGGGVFELGLNINGFTKATVTGPGELTITGTYDTIDAASGDIKTGLPLEAKVKLSVTANDVLANATVTRDGKAEAITASKEPGVDFFSQIYGVKSAEAPLGSLVRIFETGGGDPAMNGDQLILNVLSYPEEKTFDLGLNVNSLEKVTLANDTSARIEGTEDYMDANGTIKSRPYAYTIDFTIGADGAPSDVVKLTRTK